jgi:hypothetical protein
MNFSWIRNQRKIGIFGNIIMEITDTKSSGEVKILWEPSKVLPYFD